MVDANYVRYKNKFKKKSPGRVEHLKKYQWKPGESGNKNGRPTGSISLVERLKAYLRRHPEDMEALVVAIVQLGKDPNASQLSAIDKIIDRVDGKVAETHKIEG